jgi:hypothetical protein
MAQFLILESSNVPLERGRDIDHVFRARLPPGTNPSNLEGVLTFVVAKKDAGQLSYTISGSGASQTRSSHVQGGRSLGADQVAIRALAPNSDNQLEFRFTVGSDTSGPVEFGDVVVWYERRN